MAVKDFNEAKKQQKKQKKFKLHKFHILLCVATVFVVCVAVVACIIPNYVAASNYDEETAKIKIQIAELKKESEDISKSLENKEELYEKIAREEYGYCKPGEKVFYSSSFGE